MNSIPENEKGKEVELVTVNTSSSGNEHDTDSQSWTDEEEKQLLKRLDCTFLPALWMMSLISHLDRSNIGNAKIAGMGADLQLSSWQYSMVIIAFYIGYLPAGPFCNMLVMRTRPSLVLPIAVATWGMITCLEAAAKSYTHLVILRIFMGILESALTPASITMLSCWYRPAEQSRRALLYTSSVTVGGAFGGLLAGGITGSLEGAKGLRGWQWLFLVEGSITIVWAVFCVFLIPDTPENSTRFTPRQKHIAQMRLRGVGTASPTGKHNGEKKLGKLQSLKLACLDWRVYLVTLATTCLSGSFTLPYFYPTLVNQLGYKNAVTAQYMTVPIYGAAFLWAVGIAILADRVPGHRALLLALSVGYAMIMSISLLSRVYANATRYALIVLMGTGVWATLPLGVSFAATTFRDMPPEIRAVAIAIAGTGTQVGNFYGAYLFPAEAAPRYLAGFGTVAATQGACMAVYLFIWVHLRRREARLGLRVL